MRIVMMAVAAVAAIATMVRAEGPWSAVSDNQTALNTRSLSRVTESMDKSMDTRSFTADWSEARRLNTKRILGTILLMR